jgi:hypothetical protein
MHPPGEVALNSAVPTLRKCQVRNANDPHLGESPGLDSLALPLRPYIHIPTRNTGASRSYMVRTAGVRAYETALKQLRHRLQKY